MFGLPFPTWLGWVINPLQLVIILSVIIVQYRKYLKTQESK